MRSHRETPMPFRDRTDAGTQLAEVVAAQALSDPIVLALPRGGVPVGFPVALRLKAPLEVFVARKIGAPRRPEAGIGAVAEGGGLVVDQRAVEALGLSTDELSRRVATERRELDRRVERYRGDRPLPSLAGREVVLVDDGLATGVTASAALHALHRHRPSRLVLAVPVCSPRTADRLRQNGDEVVSVQEPSDFYAVGQFYKRFDQTTDEEVLALLAQARHREEVGR